MGGGRLGRRKTWEEEGLRGGRLGRRKTWEEEDLGGGRFGRRKVWSSSSQVFLLPSLPPIISYTVAPDPLSFSTLTAIAVTFLARPYVLDITVPVSGR